MKTIFNAEALVSVEIVDKKPCKYVQWIDVSAKSFWEKLFSSRNHDKNGFYCRGILHDSFIEEQQITTGVYPSNPQFILNGIELLVEDKIVYHKPYVRLSFAGGKSSITEFNSYELAKEWGEVQVKKNMSATIIC